MGWNGSDKNAPVIRNLPRKSSFGRKGLLVCGLLIVVVLGICGYCFIASFRSVPMTTADKTKASVPAPRKIAVVSPARAPMAKKPDEVTIAKPTGVDLTHYSEEFLRRASKNPETMFAITNVVSEEERRKRAEARPFKTSTEQAMNWIFNAKLGEMAPLPPMEINEKDFPKLMEMLKQPIAIKDDDTEDLASRKDMVNLAKEELLKYMNEGGNPNEFLRYYREELIKAYEFRKMSVEEFAKVCDSEDSATARDFFKALNEHLRQKGMEKLQLSDERREQIGLPVEDTDNDDENEE